MDIPTLSSPYFLLKEKMRDITTKEKITLGYKYIKN